MNVLLIGSGGREHALAWKMSQSPQLDHLYTVPGNAGTAMHGENIQLAGEDETALLQLAREKAIELVVIGPEAPLVAGLADSLRAAGILVVGPGRKAALLEGSKIAAKQFMQEFAIPTAPFGLYTNRHSAREAIANRDAFPVVIKADGLAAGKGVLICSNRAEANSAIDALMLDKQFGEAGARLIIEDFIPGREISLLAFTDGKTLIPMASAKDYKRVGEGDSGPNTGGMGAISPNPHFTEVLMEACKTQIIAPFLRGLASRDLDYRGIIYFGLMIGPEGLQVLEFNVRFGDPETQVILPRLSNDLLEVFTATANGQLHTIELGWQPQHAATVVLASGGYPGSYTKGMNISGLDAVSGALVFHAGSERTDAGIVSSGGRVLAVTAMAASTAEAVAMSYREMAKIGLAKSFYRKDIGG
jgi:phosphoribosylamine--glycine ligase